MNKYGIAIWVNEYPCEDIEYITNYSQLYPTKEKAQKELNKLIKADCEKLNNELKQNVLNTYKILKANGKINA